MKLKLWLLTLFCVGSVLAAVAAPPVAVADSPAEVATEFFRAIVRGDQAAAESMVVGADAGKAVAGAIKMLADMKTAMLKDPEGAKRWKCIEGTAFVDARIDGDTAVVFMVVTLEIDGRKIEQKSSDPWKLRKVDGKWKVVTDK